MASRFEIVDEEYIEELKGKSENKNTKNNTEWWKTIFKKSANEWNLQANSARTISSTKDCRSFKHSEILASMLLTSNRNLSS